MISRSLRLIRGAVSPERRLHLFTLFSYFSSLLDHARSLESNVFIQSALITSADNKAHSRRFLISQSNAARRRFPVSHLHRRRARAAQVLPAELATTQSERAAGRMRALDSATNTYFHCKDTDEHMQSWRFSLRAKVNLHTAFTAERISGSCSDSGPEKLKNSR